MKEKLLSVKNTLVAFVALVAVWEVAYLATDFPEALFPGPASAVASIVKFASNGLLWENIAASLYRYAVGFISAVVLAVVLGLIFGWFSRAWKYVNPIAQFIRPIAPVAWMPFIVLWLGIGDVPAIAIIFIAAFFPVLLGTVSAVQNVDKTYLKVAKNFGIKSPQILWKVIFPAAFPNIVTSISMAIGTAWIFLVSGEMIGAQSGLGYMIIDARNNLASADLIAAIIVIGIIGLLLDALVKFVARKVTAHWGGAS